MFTLVQCLLKNTNSFTGVLCGICLKRKIHQFRNTIPWKTTLGFSEYLIKSVIYNDNGLLVLNKPYGVTFSRDGGITTKESAPNPEDRVFNKSNPNKNKITQNTYYTSGITDDSLNLIDCLPYLKKHFGYNKLFVARVPEKYVSGVAILTTSDELVDRVNYCRRHAPTGKDRYLAVVVGVPRYVEGNVKLGFQLENDPKKGKRVVLLHKWSKSAYKHGEVRIGTFHHRTICSGFDNLTSLVEVWVELRKYHAYRVFCSNYLLSPVLGDNLFGSRVHNIMGVPMLVHQFSDVANAPQKLRKEIFNLLALTSNEASLIPVHMHLSEMLLPKFFRGGESLLLKAPLPPHFQWTCDRLGLSQPELAQIEAV